MLLPVVFTCFPPLRCINLWTVFRYLCYRACQHEIYTSSAEITQYLLCHFHMSVSLIFFFLPLAVSMKGADFSKLFSLTPEGKALVFRFAGTNKTRCAEVGGKYKCFRKKCYFLHAQRLIPSRVYLSSWLISTSAHLQLTFSANGFG